MDSASDQQPLVVGVDGSHGSKRALRWALEEAQRRASPVVAVMAWEPPVGTWSSPMGAVPIDAFTRRDYEAEAQRDLQSVVSEVAADFPDVTVECRACVGNAVTVILGMADTKSADLVVVGSRGRGGFSRLLLGSVSEQCAMHAHCSVVIVR